MQFDCVCGALRRYVLPKYEIEFKCLIKVVDNRTHFDSIDTIAAVRNR